MLPTDRASTAEPSAASAAHPSTSAAAAKRAACVPAIDRFSSAENYFPVFETTTKDLQQLEAAVVSNVTAFYTYMKTMRDYLRRLADLQSEQPNFEEARASTVTNIIYMLFLAYESAQRAIHELVEYEPERDECTITIYLTELQAYRFLLKRFPSNDLRHRRLLLRRDPYVAAIAELTAAVEVGDGREWDAAKETMPDLLALCREIFGADVIEKATMDARAMRALKKLEGPKRRRVAAGRVSMASS